MKIVIGKKIYTIPDVSNLNEEDYDKVRDLNSYINKLDSKITLRHMKNKVNKFAESCVNYALSNKIIMDIKTKLDKLESDMIKKDIEKELAKTKIATPKDTQDEKYNSILDNCKQAWTEIIEQVDEKAQEFHKKAQKSLETINKEIGIETQKSEPEKTYTLDEILREYEGKIPQKEFTEAERQKVDDIITEFEEQKRNRNLMNEKKNELSSELQENLNVIDQKYNQKSISKTEGFFLRIKNFFMRKKSQKNLEKNIKNEKNKNLLDIIKSIKKAFEPKHKSEESREKILASFKQNTKRAMAVSIAALGLTSAGSTIPENENRIEQESNSTKQELNIKADSLMEIGNVYGVVAKNNIIEFKAAKIDNRKFNMIIDKKDIMYKEIMQIMDGQNINVTENQIEEVIKKFIDINGLGIDRNEKAKLLKNYLENNEDGLSAKEKAEILKLYINKNKGNNSQEKKENVQENTENSSIHTEETLENKTTQHRQVEPLVTTESEKKEDDDEKEETKEEKSLENFANTTYRQVEPLATAESEKDEEEDEKEATKEEKSLENFANSTYRQVEPFASTESEKDEEEIAEENEKSSEKFTDSNYKHVEPIEIPNPSRELTWEDLIEKENLTDESSLDNMYKQVESNYDAESKIKEIEEKSEKEYQKALMNLEIELIKCIRDGLAENKDVEDLKEEMNAIYPIENMEEMGILNNNAIESIINDSNLTEIEKIDKLMELITSSREKYEKIVTGENVDEINETDKTVDDDREF